MRRAGLALLLLSSTLSAQSPQKKFASAYAEWTTHRPDGMTWDDDSATATSALGSMWSSAAQVAVDFLATHPAAGAQELSKKLSSLLPETDPRFGPPISASALEIEPGTFVVAFNSYPAGTVFAIHRTPNSASAFWQLSLEGEQANDPQHLLASWHAGRAGDACVTKNSYASGICGPMTSVSIGPLPPTRAGQPRFFIWATYSKDMGGTDDEQVSVWNLTGSRPKLEWINLFAQGGDEETVPDGIQFKDGTLLIAEKHEFSAFTSCGSCSGRQMIHHLRIEPDGVEDAGLQSVHPELDTIDELFEKIFAGQPAAELASAQVIQFLRPRLQLAKASSQKIDPSWYSVGMLEGFKLEHQGDTDVLCFQADDFGPADFTLQRTTHGYFVTRVSERPDGKQCGGTL